MMRELNHIQLLRYVGMVTWALVGCWLLNAWLDPDYLRLEEGESVWSRIMPWLVVYFTFGVCYWWITRSIGRREPRWIDHAALLVMTVCAIGVSYFSATGLGSVLLMVMAALLPWILSVRVGLVWMLAGNLAFVPLFVMAMNYSPILAVIQALLYVGFSGLVFVTAFVAMQQATAREEQRRLNSELRATRVLLAESARVNERTRISRELHDLLGHHLTALSLNLEVAGHLADGKTRDHVKQAHTLAKLLLTDVREAVSNMRENGGIDLATALRPLAENVPGLSVELDVQEALRVEDPDLAHVILRTTQEIITNAVRHAGASVLHISVQVREGHIHLTARDNGQGADLVTAGNGLSGMRERIKAQDGKLDIQTAPGQGFALIVTLPLQAMTA
jgi:signal transduction histidine kinase